MLHIRLRSKDVSDIDQGTLALRSISWTRAVFSIYQPYTPSFIYYNLQRGGWGYFFISTYMYICCISKRKQREATGSTGVGNEEMKAGFTMNCIIVVCQCIIICVLMHGMRL